ncbi:hypothetical protein CLOSTMETH_03260 [[Clostridium] methylpentosum DSM 5476]|uniref:Uncharacterized protein n=1 Tax=[Clostridium] methylpentosum DSM 5476 TaxID=537013 RepID=C0EH60_9FIRM|nr:hypothetical protein CLOSTMETH_03260 [[Clostridium] methylpentosum DSM 5476]
MLKFFIIRLTRRFENSFRRGCSSARGEGKPLSQALGKKSVVC